MDGVRMSNLQRPTSSQPQPGDQPAWEVDPSANRTNPSRISSRPTEFEESLRQKKNAHLAPIYNTFAEQQSKCLGHIFAYFDFECVQDGTPRLTADSIFTTNDTEQDLDGQYLVHQLFTKYRLSTGHRKQTNVTLTCIAFESPVKAGTLPYLERFRHYYESSANEVFRDLLIHLLLFSKAINQTDLHRIKWNLWTRVHGEDVLTWTVRLPSQGYSPETVWPPDLTSFTWVRPPAEFFKPLSFWQTLSFYAKRSYRYSPHLQGAILHCIRHGDGVKISTVVTFSSDSSLARFRRDFLADDSNSIKGNVYIDLQASVLCKVLVVLGTQMIADIAQFIPSSHRFARQLEFESRDDPGKSKFLQISHVRDYLNSTTASLNTAIRTLTCWETSRCSEEDLQQLAKVKTDLVYLVENCGQVQQFVNETLERMLALSTIQQAKTTASIGFIAATYVPMAFVGTYLGMNVREFTNGGLQSVTTFWKAAVPLAVACVVLPVIAGSLLQFGFTLGRDLVLGWKYGWPQNLALLFCMLLAGFVLSRLEYWGETHDMLNLYHKRSHLEPVFWNFIAGALLFLSAIAKILRGVFEAKFQGYLLFFASFTFLLCGGFTFMDKTNATFWVPWVVFGITALLFIAVQNGLEREKKLKIGET